MNRAECKVHQTSGLDRIQASEECPPCDEAISDVFCYDFAIPDVVPEPA